MNAVLVHYMDGSACAAWLRMCRAIEAAEDFAPLSVGPLEPEPTEAADPQELPA